MLVKEYITRELDLLNDAQLQQLAEYLAFLKFRAHLPSLPIQMKDKKLHDLYAQFEEDDLLLTEVGLKEYVAVLALEDAG